MYLALAEAVPGFSQPAVEQVVHLSYRNGLSDRTVNDLCQDSKGFLWLATGNGLNRFDGHRFLVFDNNPTTRFQLSQNAIAQVEELAGQQLALLNESPEGFFELLDLNSFQIKKIGLNRQSGLAGQVKSIFLQRHGAAFVLTELPNSYGIFKYSGGRFVKMATIAAGKKIGAGQVHFILGPSGKFWVADTANGLFEADATGRVTRQFPIESILQKTAASTVPYTSWALHEDQNGQVWAAFPHRTGMVTIRPGSQDLQLQPGLPAGEVYNKIWEDEKGHLLVGSFRSFGELNRLFLVKKNGQTADYQWLLDIDDKVNDVFSHDFDKLIVLGTHVGVYKVKLKSQPFRWLLAERQLEDRDWDNGISIRSIVSDQQGNIYISRELTAWYKSTIGSGEATAIELKNERGEPLDLWCNSKIVLDPTDGVLWGGSCTDDRNGLLHRYDPASGVTRTLAVPGKTIRHIVKQADGRLALIIGAEIGERQLLFFDIKNSVFEKYTNADGSNPFEKLLPNYLLEGMDGTLWVGTEEGLLGIDPKQKKTRVYKRGSSGLTNDHILVIHEAADGRLWLGTLGGLNILDVATGRAKTYNTSHGLCNNTVCGILPDGQGGFWLSTFYGLSHFDPKEGLFSNFYLDKGLTFNEFNRFAFHLDVEGNFYFGTLNGINIFKNEDLYDDQLHRFAPQWTRMAMTDNKGVTTDQTTGLGEVERMVMKRDEDLLRLEFALPVFEHPERSRFAIKIEGIDTAWRYLGPVTHFDLTRPPAGVYKLRVKAAPANGFWLAEELQFDLKVRHLFYQTALFQIGFPLLVLLVSYLISKWFIARIKRQEVEQTRVNKKFAELELQALQAQMNPHFVFNSLAAIQYFIQKNNPAAADDYLGKFAKLMRLFLESSKNKYIPLAEEIKLLSLYVELEQMRFGDKFSAEIHVDSAIDTHAREIPSILIQPFVENAINHGLFNKKSNGFLRVNFEEETDGSLLCTIEDNGVGRRKAEELKMQDTHHHHRSRGMQIVRERLEVLQQVDDMKVDILMEDLTPEAEEAGTRVVIRLPDLD